MQDHRSINTALQGEPSAPDKFRGAAFNKYTPSETSARRIPSRRTTSAPKSAPPINSSQSVDIDDLVRKIDAKIAEIEKEEKTKSAEVEKPVKPEKTTSSSDSIISTESIENKVNDIIRTTEQVFGTQTTEFLPN